MNLAVISLTAQGRRQSEKLKMMLKEHSVRRFCFYRHTDSDAVSFTDLQQCIAELFPVEDALIFVCACGIAVRMIAPHIRTKQTDPAVLVMDDCGKFVIPVLSGHLGGANALAEQIAARLPALPIITTATDTGGRFSPDSFAQANGLYITDFVAAKAVAAAVLRDEKIGLSCAYPYCNLPPEISPEDLHLRTGIYIGTDVKEQPFPVTLRLLPKNIVLGIGCKRGTSAEAISAAVKAAFLEKHIVFSRICAVSSINLKADEPGLLAFCRENHLPLLTYSAQELAALSGDFSASEFVRNVTGIDNVCERSAVLCSGGSLILRKTVWGGVTAAAAERPVSVDFERKLL